MTVHDDLARLELVIDRAPGRSVQHRERDMEAYKRVEGEIARLEAELARVTLLQQAENARLRDGLRRIADIPTGAVDDGMHPRDIARALLADQDGAA